MDSLQANTRSTFKKETAKITLAYLLSLLIAVLMAAASWLGLLNPDAIYPSEALRQSFFANDVVNLVMGFPALLIALWLTWRGKLAGLLFWPGALMFVLYNYLAYVFSMPPGWYYLLLLTIVTLSGYTLIGLVPSFDLDRIQDRLEGAIPVRLTGILLVVFGAFVFLRVFSVIAGFVSDPGSVAPTDLAILPADFMISPAWIIGGVLL